MRDNLGLYYYPNPEDKSTRMYVREQDGEIEFRLWRRDYPEVWEKHQWTPLSVIQDAAALYQFQRAGTDPMRLYDANVARALLRGQA